ncbi:MAG: hypothetical protein J5761_00045 [Paludibacteraceae bacterium]|nr:hypothetical protein [Paludibacteraceae bacterium]
MTAWMLLGCAVTSAFASYQNPYSDFEAATPPSYNFASTSSYNHATKAGQSYTPQAASYSPASSTSGYKPTQVFTVRHSAASVYSTGGGASATSGVVSYSRPGKKSGPIFNSGSTSITISLPKTTYTTAVDENTETGSGMRRSNVWDEPTDDPIGVVPEPVPVGEPLILLVLAMMYIIWKKAKLSWRKQPNK